MTRSRETNRATVSLGSVVRHWIVYGFGSASGRLIGLLMLPVYTTYLSPEEFGIKAIVVAIGNVVMLFMAVGIQSAVFRFYWDEQDRPRPEVISAGLFGSIGLAAVCLWIALVFSDAIAALAFGESGYGVYVRVGLIALVLNFVQDVPLSYLQVRRQSVSFAIISVIRVVLAVLFNIVFVVVMEWGVLGILYADAIVAGLFALVLPVWTFREVGGAVSLRTLGEMVRYGAPALVVTFGWLLMNAGDRFLLTHLASLSEVGLYSLGHQIASIVLIMVIEPFRRVWGPQQFEVYRQQNADEVVARVFRFFVGAMLFMGFLLAAFARDVLTVMAHPAFLGAAVVVPALVVSQFMMGVHFIFTTGILIRKRMSLVGMLVLSAALVNLALNVVLIPRLGALGAGVSRALAISALAIFTAVVARRVYAIEFGGTAVFPLVGATVGVFALSLYVPTAPLGVSVGLKACLSLLLLVYVARTILDGRWTNLRRLVDTMGSERSADAARKAS